MSSLLWLRWCGVMRRDEQWLCLVEIRCDPALSGRCSGNADQRGETRSPFAFFLLRQPSQLAHFTHSLAHSNESRGRALATRRFHSHDCTPTVVTAAASPPAPAAVAADALRSRSSVRRFRASRSHDECRSCFHCSHPCSSTSSQGGALPDSLGGACRCGRRGGGRGRALPASHRRRQSAHGAAGIRRVGGRCRGSGILA